LALLYFKFGGKTVDELAFFTVDFPFQAGLGAWNGLLQAGVRSIAKYRASSEYGKDRPLRKTT